MQLLKKNTKAGLITLGVVVALLAVLLTPGFFQLSAAALPDSAGFQDQQELVSSNTLRQLAGESAQALKNLVKKASLH